MQTALFALQKTNNLAYRRRSAKIINSLRDTKSSHTFCMQKAKF